MTSYINRCWRDSSAPTLWLFSWSSLSKVMSQSGSGCIKGRAQLLSWSKMCHIMNGVITHSRMCGRSRYRLRARMCGASGSSHSSWCLGGHSAFNGIDLQERRAQASFECEEVADVTHLNDVTRTQKNTNVAQMKREAVFLWLISSYSSHSLFG